MRKIIIVLCLIASGLIILDSFNAASALFMFMIDGSIPGTDINLPANMMLGGIVVIAGIVILRLILLPIFQMTMRKKIIKITSVKKASTRRPLSRA